MEERVASPSATMPSVRCSFCLKPQLLGGRNVANSVKGELVQISPVVSAHILCLQSAFGLPKRNGCDYSNEEIVSELKRCQQIECSFCKRKGAAVACTVGECRQNFHLSCFYVHSGTVKKGKRSVVRVFCQSHIGMLGNEEVAKSRKRKYEKEVQEITPKRKKKTVASEVVSPPTRSLCNAVSCKCPKGENFYNSRMWALKFCHKCHKASVHTICAGPKLKWLCDWCKTKKKTDEKPKKTSPKSKQASPDSGSKLQNGRQAQFKSPIKCMKKSFCSDIDPHLKTRRRTERSPLGPKQKEFVEEGKDEREKLKSSTAGALFNGQLQIGKENKKISVKKGKSLHKKDKWIVRKDLVKQPTMKNSTKLKKPGNSQSKKSDTLKPRSPPPAKRSGGQQTNVVKKSSPVLPGESSPAKKFVENVTLCSDTGSSSAKRNLSKIFDKTVPKSKKICDKLAAASDQQSKCKENGKKVQKKAKVGKMVTKINVEPKKLADRQLHHVRNSLPLLGPEPEAEEDYQWLVDAANRQVDDFLDLNDGEKAFFKLWNTHLHHNPCFGDAMMVPILEKFIEENGEEIWKKNLFRNFMLHLTNFYEFGILDQMTIILMTRRVQLHNPLVSYDVREKERKFLAETCDAKEETNTALVMKQQSLSCDSAKEMPVLAGNKSISVVKEKNHSSRRSNMTTRSSRCSSPAEDCVSIASSEKSMRLYLSDSNEEDEDADSSRSSNNSNFSIKLRSRPGMNSSSQSVRKSLRRSNESVNYVNDRTIASIADLPAFESGSLSFASATVSYDGKKTRRGANVGQRPRPNLRMSRRSFGAIDNDAEAKRLVKIVRRGDGHRRNCSL